jgi:hypothetical protein
VPISPESFNRIRDANTRYGAAQETLGVAKAVAESSPTEANLMNVEAAELEANRALRRFDRALGAADLHPTALEG